MKDRLKTVGEIRPFIVQDGDLSSLERIAKGADSGIVLLSENSMIDTYGLDSFENGDVESQSVDLERMKGNSQVLEMIKLMKSKKKVAFFPGTLLRSYGSYSLPVMPVIYNGEIIMERVKQTGIPYMHGNKPLSDEVRREAVIRKEGNMASVSISGLNILPVICNELALVPELYNGKAVDVVLHSCEDLYSSVEERASAYQKLITQMRDKGLLVDSMAIATAETGENPYRKVLFFETEKPARLGFSTK